MSYPSQIDREQVVTQAHALVEAGGAEALTLGRVAAVLGVKTPSLYRYISGKEELLQAVNLLTLEQLFAALHEALAEVPAGSTPRVRLHAVCHALRRFAHAHPRTYLWAMSSDGGDYRPDEALLVQMVLPIQELMAELVGEAHSLPALRGVLALVHGFVILELNNQLRRGGDLDAAFEQSLAALLAGWTVIAPDKTGHPFVIL